MANTAERWRDEVRMAHRWGREKPDAFAERMPGELEELEALWGAAAPLGEADEAVMDQILSLEICNWRLVESAVELSEAIGRHEPSTAPIGHRNSVTPERWKVAWAYYLALQQYVWGDRLGCDGFAPMLEAADPDGAVADKVAGLLGEKNERKELLVQRLLYAMQWIVSHFPWGSTWHHAQNAAIQVIEERLAELDADPKILEHLKWGYVDGRVQPCSHKFVRRLDILISSIGAGEWRGAMPFRGTDGLERASELGSCLDPILAWVRQDASMVQYKDEPGATILANLGEPDPTKRFLARLLHSLLAAQQLSARMKGEYRSAGATTGRGGCTT